MANARRHDVVVIGAGLAGLRAAITLGHAGRDVVVLEAAAAVGGRQRTDAVDGFLLDRGFQVLNPAYPAVRRWIDVQALRLKPFPVGVQVRRENGVEALADPRRHPSMLAAILRSGLLPPRDAAALTRWAAPALVAPRSVIRHAAAGGDLPVREGWDRAGLTGPLRREVLEPFLSGVIADGSFETSVAFVRLLIRMFARGATGVARARHPGSSRAACRPRSHARGAHRGGPSRNRSPREPLGCRTSRPRTHRRACTSFRQHVCCRPRHPVVPARCRPRRRFDSTSR